MEERGSLGHSLLDTLGQICSILIKETHFLQLAVHSEWQTSCNLGFREECNVCTVPKSGWEEKIKMYTACRPINTQWLLCGVLYLSWGHQGFYPLTARIDFFHHIIMLMCKDALFEKTSAFLESFVVTAWSIPELTSWMKPSNQKPSNKLVSISKHALTEKPACTHCSASALDGRGKK